MSTARSMSARAKRCKWATSLERSGASSAALSCSSFRTERRARLIAIFSAQIALASVEKPVGSRRLSSKPGLARRWSGGARVAPRNQERDRVRDEYRQQHHSVAIDAVQKDIDRRVGEDVIARDCPALLRVGAAKIPYAPEAEKAER